MPASNLYIRQKTQINKLQTAKEMIRTLGINPEQLITKEALSKSATTHKDQENHKNHQFTVLTNHIKLLIHQAATG
jgi:DNA-binding protein H-NS